MAFGSNHFCPGEGRLNDMSGGTLDDVAYVIPFLRRGEMTHEDAVEFVKNENGALPVKMEHALGACMLRIAQGNCPRYSSGEISTR